MKDLSSAFRTRSIIHLPCRHYMTVYSLTYTSAGNDCVDSCRRCAHQQHISTWLRWERLHSLPGPTVSSGKRAYLWMHQQGKPEKLQKAVSCCLISQRSDSTKAVNNCHHVFRAHRVAASKPLYAIATVLRSLSEENSD